MRHRPQSRKSLTGLNLSLSITGKWLCIRFSHITAGNTSKTRPQRFTWTHYYTVRPTGGDDIKQCCDPSVRLSVCLSHVSSSKTVHSGLWFLQNTNRKPGVCHKSNPLASSHRKWTETATKPSLAPLQISESFARWQHHRSVAMEGAYRIAARCLPVGCWQPRHVVSRLTRAHYPNTSINCRTSEDLSAPAILFQLVLCADSCTVSD